MTTYNTGNPLGSSDPRDLYDNAQNLDEAVNSDSEEFEDRLGKRRLTIQGMVEAATTGNPAVGAAQDALASADRAEAQADRAELEVADGINAGVSQVTGFATAEADRAEAAADIASTAGLIFPTSAEGQDSAALSSGDYFWVESSQSDGALELWRKGASSPTDTGRRSASPASVAQAKKLATTGIYDTAWVSGGLHPSSGNPVIRSYRIRPSQSLIPLIGEVTVTASNPDQRCFVFQYDQNGVYLGHTTDGRQEQVAKVNGYFSVAVGWADDRPISPSENSVVIRVSNSSQYEAARDLNLTGEYHPIWTPGGLSVSTGLPVTTRPDRVRILEGKIPLRGLITVKMPEGQAAAIFRYDQQGDFIDYTSTIQEHNLVEVDGFFNIAAGKTDDGDVIPGDISAQIQLFPDNPKLEVVSSDLREVSSDLHDLILRGVYKTDWVQGGLGINFGNPTVRPERVRMIEHLNPLDGFLSVSLESPDQLATVFLYDADKNYIGYSETAAEFESLKVEGYFNITVRWVVDGPILPEDVSATIRINRGSSAIPGEQTDWLNDLPKFSSVPFGDTFYLPYTEKESLFESLLEAYPANVVKQKIGESYNGAHDVNAYFVTPDSYMVTVAVTMHTHGNERYNPVGFYALLDQISNPGPKHELLQWCRHNVRWIIVPFVSPMAYVNNTRSTNSVNINRNFDYRWEFHTEGDGGAFPNSEVEVQNIVNFFTPLKDEIDFHMDLHDIPGSPGANYSHRPYHNREFLWMKPMMEVKEYLAKINQGVAGGDYVGDVGSHNNFFNSNLGIPSMVHEHVTQWWISKGLNGDQQAAKSMEQTAAYIYMFRHLFDDQRNSPFYARLFERSFGSQEYGYSGWDSSEVMDAFASLSSVTTASPGVYERAGSGEKTIMVIAGVQPDDNNSALTVLRCMERIEVGREMYVEHLQNCNFVIVPVINPTGADESTLQSSVNLLVSTYQPDYTVVVRAPKLDGVTSETVARIGSAGEETTQTRNSGLEIDTIKVGIENYLTTPYTVFELGNQVHRAGEYPHCVAEWVKYVLNDMASFYIS